MGTTHNEPVEVSRCHVGGRSAAYAALHTYYLSELSEARASTALVSAALCISLQRATVSPSAVPALTESVAWPPLALKVIHRTLSASGPAMLMPLSTLKRSGSGGCSEDISGR